MTRLNLPVIFIRRFPDIDGFIYFIFMSCDRWALDHTDQNQNERLIVEGAINRFLYDTVVVTIANIIGESWFRIHVH